MPRAVFINDRKDERAYDLRFLPVYVMYRGRLWRRQADDPARPEIGLYRDTNVLDLEQLVVNTLDGEPAPA